MTDIKRELISATMAAFLAVGGTMVVFWKDTSVVSAAAEQRLQQLERADSDSNARIDSLQVEMRQVYTMASKLDAISEDLKQLRQDVRELRAAMAPDAARRQELQRLRKAQ